MLRKSDGTAAACGNNRYGDCIIPALDVGLLYVASSHAQLAVVCVLKASYDGAVIGFLQLDGESVAELEVDAAERLSHVRLRLAKALSRASSTIDVVFPIRISNEIREPTDAPGLEEALSIPLLEGNGAACVPGV